MFLEESSGKHRQQESVPCVRIDVRDFYLCVCKKASFVGYYKVRFTLSLKRGHSRTPEATLGLTFPQKTPVAAPSRWLPVAPAPGSHSFVRSPPTRTGVCDQQNVAEVMLYTTSEIRS